MDITIVCDFIHTMEYLWKAAHCFHKAGSNEARQWVADHARLLLDGSDPSQVVAGMRRSATLRKIEKRAAPSAINLPHACAIHFAPASASPFVAPAGDTQGDGPTVAHERFTRFADGGVDPSFERLAQATPSSRFTVS